jgi:hypothetical protein
VVSAKKVERDIWLITNDPTVVRHRWNIKELTRAQFEDTSILESGRGGAGEHQANVFNVATGGSHTGADVHAPFPAGLVGSSTDRHTAEVYQLKTAFL